jgi:uncharacterized protein YtpQ (UPF0354 family)
MYINVPRKDVLAIIVLKREMYINVPRKDVLAIIVIRENCSYVSGKTGVLVYETCVAINIWLLSVSFNY